MAAAQIAKKLKDKRQKNYIEGIFKKVIYWRCFLPNFLSITKSIMTKKAIKFIKSGFRFLVTILCRNDFRHSISFRTNVRNLFCYS